MVTNKFISFCFVLFCIPTILLAQTTSEEHSNCKEANAFDFWLGDWTIQARERPPGSQDWQKNTTWIQTHVRSVLAGCAIIEESIDQKGSDTLIVGMSMTSFNSTLGKYQQLWVDQNGFTWEYVGNWEGEQMVLYLEPATANGEATVPFQKTTLIRMVFREISDDRLVWSYEYSVDEGESWTSTNEAVYTRIKG